MRNLHIFTQIYTWDSLGRKKSHEYVEVVWGVGWEQVDIHMDMTKNTLY